jgi:uncharacterized membrane protein YcaP (DUF421 family)
MESIVRAALVYTTLLVIFRLSGKRSLAQITMFDFVLTLIISESIQNALVGDDMSLTNGLLVVITLVTIDIGLSLLKGRSRQLEKVLDSVPIMLIENGQLYKDRMNKARVDEEDILESARERLGIARMDQIKYAVLERSGGISVIPYEQ